jgi:hypothetical protein
LHELLIAENAEIVEVLLIGDFDREIEAARAYDAKARQLFGDYASLNMPP